MHALLEVAPEFLWMHDSAKFLLTVMQRGTHYSKQMSWDSPTRKDIVDHVAELLLERRRMLNEAICILKSNLVWLRKGKIAPGGVIDCGIVLNDLERSS